MWIEILTVRLEFHLWIRYLFAYLRLGVWVDDLERWEDLDVRSGPSRSQEGNCVWWSLCSVNCCFFVLVAAMAQAMACSCSVASKFAWKLSSESPLFASIRSCNSCSSPIALFSFCLSSSFRKVRAIQRQRLRSHVLALAGCGSPSLAPFHHLEDLIFNFFWIIFAARSVHTVSSLLTVSRG